MTSWAWRRRRTILRPPTTHVQYKKSWTIMAVKFKISALWTSMKSYPSWARVQAALLTRYATNGAARSWLWNKYQLLILTQGIWTTSWTKAQWSKVSGIRTFADKRGTWWTGRRGFSAFCRSTVTGVTSKDTWRTKTVFYYPRHESKDSFWKYYLRLSTCTRMTSSIAISSPVIFFLREKTTQSKLVTLG